MLSSELLIGVVRVATEKAFFKKITETKRVVIKFKIIPKINLSHFKISMERKMKMYILIVATFLCSISIYSQGSIPEKNYLDFDMSGSLTAGLNPVDQEPLPESDWSINLSGFFEGSCAEFNEHKYYLEDKIESFTEYLAPEGEACVSINYLEDIEDELVWSDIGIVQESFFAVEDLECDVALLNCDIGQDLRIEDQIYSRIFPTPGLSGTAGGRAEVFLYDSLSYSHSNESGGGGLGGLSNLVSEPSTQRYCLQKLDYDQGEDTSFAKSPVVNLIQYTWKPIISSSSANDGQSAKGTVKKSELIKGLDSSMLFWVSKDNVIDGQDR